MGLEPTTFSLATRRSTTELCPLIIFEIKLVVFLYLSKCLNKIDNLIMQLQDYLIAKQPDSELSVLKSVLKEVLVK